MINFSQIDVGVLIAVVTAISSAISIITNKIFEIIIDKKKHKRIVIEKIIDSKLSACKSAISFYGGYLNSLYQTKFTFENLDSTHYSQILFESQKLSEECLKQNLLSSNNNHFHILLFYDLYGKEDEEIANKITNCNRNYYDYIMSNSNNVSSSQNQENELRKKLVEAIDEAIKYFKCKIEIVRKDLKNLEK